MKVKKGRCGDVIGAPRARSVALACLLACLLAACSSGGSETDRPEPQPLAPATPWLTEITDEVGLDFTHEAGPTGEFMLPEIMGSGAALFDYDNDGDLDIYLTTCNWSLVEGSDREAPVNKLYRHDDDGSFTDVTAEAGLGDDGYGMGLAIGDIDNDGDEDLFVTNYGPDRLYRNRGDGTFEEIAEESGAAVDGWSVSASFLDYDRDGFLDLYVTRYVEYDPTIDCFDTAGRRDYCGPTVFKPATDVLLRNNGDGTFTDTSEISGIASVSAAGLGLICEDLNEDGWVDVYTANDAYANQLWLNQRDGTFRDEGLVMGVAYNMHGHAEAGMGVLAADFDNDAFSDLFVTHLRKETNTIYRNNGDGTGFSDISAMSGLGKSSMPYTGFGTIAVDVELDGDLDILVANGRVQRGDPLPGAGVPPPWDLFSEPNLFYLNDGSARFSLACDLLAPFCEPIEITRALATGDIDDDGDLDVLVSNIQGRARLYRNDAPRAGHWLSVRAFDPRLNRDALGARVVLVFSGSRQLRTISSGYSYLSSSPPRAHFGLGDASSADRIEVTWPDGLKEQFPVGAVDRVLRVERASGEPLR